MTAYYNEIDEYAADWLRNLIKAGHIADGIVDTRSILDIEPYDLREFTQCHFFAGIGVWSLALRLSGWPDDRPVWTGSCPCQPFSSAGRSGGFADERHLWPHWHHLIRERRPAVVFGEQVASKAVEPWIDLVHADMEAVGYAFAGVPFPSAGGGAPHIRDRLFWVADPQQHHSGCEAAAANNVGPQADGPADQYGGHRGASVIRLADTDGGTGHQGGADFRGRVNRSDAQSRAGSRSGVLLGGVGDTQGERCGEAGQPGTRPAQRSADASTESCGMADSEGKRRGRREGLSAGGFHDGANARRLESVNGLTGIGQAGNVARPAGPTNGFWANADWLLCRDGKWRPVEPGTFPLAHGAPARVGRLRAYGNAINAQAAAEFIGAYLDAVAVGDLL